MEKNNVFSIFLVLFAFSYGSSSPLKDTHFTQCPQHARPMDCEEVLENGYTKSGIYTIWPRNRFTKCQTLRVYCDMETDGGGWTVIQRRGQFNTPEDYFNKNWNEYKNGFGKLHQEFWLGNDNIFALTFQGIYSIRFDLTHRNGSVRFSQYDQFWIDDENHQYRLHLNDFIRNLNPEKDGGDAMSTHSLRDFYTSDRPNVPKGVDLKDKKNPGGWWNNAIPSSNLNGLNKKSNFGSQDNIMWYTSGGFDNSLLSTEMKIKSNHF